MQAEHTYKCMERQVNTCLCPFEQQLEDRLKLDQNECLHERFNTVERRLIKQPNLYYPHLETRISV